MRKGNITVVASILAMLVVAGVVGAGTVAYFMDTGTSDGNTFTANSDFGIELSNDGEKWGEGVSATWTMDNMVPGAEVIKILYIKNTGSVPIKALIGDLDMVVPDGSWELVSYFYVKDCSVRFYDSDSETGDLSDPITDWASFYSYVDGWTPRPITDEVAWIDGVDTPDDWSNDALLWTGLPTDGGWPHQCKKMLGPGEIFALKYEFLFEDNDGNQNGALGDSLTLKLSYEARSSPTYEGYPPTP